MNTIPESIYEQFLQALLAGNKSACSTIVKSLMKENIEMDVLYENLLKKALYAVGELWEYNKISVATEHLASFIIDNILSEMYIYLTPMAGNGKKVVLGCVPGELHQIGIKMASDLLEKNGWETYFLGANVPAKDLIIFTRGVQPDLLALSSSLNFNLPELYKLISSFRIHFPVTPIIIGGQAFSRGGKTMTEQFEHVFVLNDLFELGQYLKNEWNIHTILNSTTP
jgi:methanogenic corrinoid protein MtbC1